MNSKNRSKGSYMEAINWLAQFPKYSDITLEELFEITELDLTGENIKELPAEIGQFTNLNVLNLSDNKLTKLPAEIGQLINLTDLYLEMNNLRKIPEEIGNLINLDVLNLEGNLLKKLPVSIGNLINLSILNLHLNELEELPEEIVQLTNLIELNLESNNLSELPEEIGYLSNLKELYLDNNPLTQLPESIGAIPNVFMSNPDLIEEYLRHVKTYEDYLASVKTIERYRIRPKIPKMEQPIFEIIDDAGKVKRMMLSLVETTEWMELCRDLSKAYGKSELVELLQQRGLSVDELTLTPQRKKVVTNLDQLTKRELCQNLALDYELEMEKVYADRNCDNDSISGVEYNKIPNTQLIQYHENGQNYCFTIDELSGLKATSGRNPYTRKPIPSSVWTEFDRKKSLLDDQDIHKTHIRTVSIKQQHLADLRQVLEEIDDPYLIHTQIEEITEEQLNDFILWLQPEYIRNPLKPHQQDDITIKKMTHIITNLLEKYDSFYVAHILTTYFE